MRQLIIATLFASAAFGRPVIDPHGVVNAASYFPQGYLAMGLAQGAMVVVFGSGLGPDRLAQADRYPLSTTLAGVSVQIKPSFGGAAVDAIPVYVSARQLGILVPSRTPPGDATVSVTYEGQTSAPEPVVIVRRAFGMFTLNQAGTGPAVAQNYNAADDQPINTLVESARPGQVVTLWGTGLGPVTYDDAQAPQPESIDAPVSVYVGSVAARVLYAGRSGCCAGIDQVVFEVPRNVEGCYVPVGVIAGPANFSTRGVPVDGLASNFGTISVSATGKVCQDPLGFTGAELTALQNKTASSVGAFFFFHDVDFGDSVSGAFVQADLLSLLRSNGIWGLPVPGSCIGIHGDQHDLRYPDPALSRRLDGGTLTVSGPAGATALKRGDDGSYSLNPVGFLRPGEYTLTGGGGKDVGAFQTAFTVPEPLVWRFRETLVGPNSINGSYTWERGDPNGYVIATVRGSNALVTESLICVERAAAGTFVAENANWIGGVADFLYGRAISIEQLQAVSPVRRFSAPGLDLGYILAISGRARTTP